MVVVFVAVTVKLLVLLLVRFAFLFLLIIIKYCGAARIKIFVIAVGGEETVIVFFNFGVFHRLVEQLLLIRLLLE